jgi:nucleoside-diphosphate-sugar epimerase
MMKVVVTGASGALGRAVVDRLVRAGDRVACVDRVIDSGQTHADPSLHCEPPRVSWRLLFVRRSFRYEQDPEQVFA